MRGIAQNVWLVMMSANRGSGFMSIYSIRKSSFPAQSVVAQGNYLILCY